MKIYILIASATDRQVQCCQRGHCQWHPTVRQHEAFVYYKSDQEQLQQKGGDLEFLYEAFSRLPRLDQLLLVDHPDQLPLSVPVHGVRKFKRTTGIPPTYHPVDKSFADEYHPWLTHVFRTMMLAVAKSGINTITQMNTYLNFSLPYGLSPATDLKFRSTTLDQLAKAFSNLTTLDLCVRSRTLRSGKEDSNEDFKVAARSLKSFAGVLKNVTCLTLASDVGPWSGPLSKSLTSHMDLSKLTKFQLDGVLINMNTLAAMVCQLKSAQMVVFVMVEIEKGSWVPILKALEMLPQLNHLHMQYLQADGQKCFFLEKPDEDEDLTEPSWLDPLTDDMLGDGDEDDEDDEWSDDDGDDESLPDLLEEGGIALLEHASQEPIYPPISPRKSKKSAPLSPTKSTKKASPACLGRTDKNHRPPGIKTGERGYYICVEGDEIREQLPTFEKGYNLGGSVLGDEFDFTGLLGNLAHMPPGAGGAIGGMFAMPVTVPVPGPPPPTPGAPAQAAGPPPNIPPALSTFGGILSVLGGIVPGPPPAPGAAATAANPGQAGNASSTTAAVPNANGVGQQDAHEGGWWENDDLVGGGALDDVD